MEYLYLTLELPELLPFKEEDEVTTELVVKDYLAESIGLSPDREVWFGF